MRASQPWRDLSPSAEILGLWPPTASQHAGLTSARGGVHLGLRRTEIRTSCFRQTIAREQAGRNIVCKHGPGPSPTSFSQYLFPPNASVQWQPDGLTIHTKKRFPGAGFLGAPPISLLWRWRPRRATLGAAAPGARGRRSVASGRPARPGCCGAAPGREGGASIGAG